MVQPMSKNLLIAALLATASAVTFAQTTAKPSLPAGAAPVTTTAAPAAPGVADPAAKPAGKKHGKKHGKKKAAKAAAAK